MTFSSTPRRRADAARNDEILLDAGLELMREKGPDRLSALDLARRAGLTTGAVYARYENNEEILVGLWQHRVLDSLRQFFIDSVEVLTASESESETDPVLSALLKPSPPLLAAVSLLIAAPRITELSEVIGPDVREILNELGVSDDRTDPRSAQILAAVSTGMGCLYFSAADMFNTADWPVIRSLIRFITHQTDFEQWPTLEPNAPFEYSIDTGDGIRDALVNAAASVIARSGIERTTTQRVARAAGLPPSALFAEYQNRQALFTDVVSKLLKEIYQEHRYRRLYGENPQPHTPTDPVAHWDDPRLVQYRESMVTSVAANTMGLLSDIGLTHRRIRLEFQLAAIHDAGVRSELQRVDEMTNVMTTSLQQSLFGLPSSIAGPGARTSRTIAQGAMLLEDVSQMLNGRDIRYINGPLADFYCRDAIGLSTDPTSAALSPQ